MKNLILFLIIALISSADAFSQTVAKKYLLLEHFTNTRCGICGNRNPAFFETIHQAQNAGEVHHIAYHPRVPYSNCLLHQHNPADNTGRADVYGIPGTPRLFIDGAQNSPSNPLVSQSKLNDLYGQTAPIRLEIIETENGNNQDVRINIKSYETLTGEDLRLFVAIVEKRIDYAAPNGESEHFDVMRRMLPDANGLSFTPSTVGAADAIFELNYTLAEEWAADQIYVIAFVQNMATKEVMNSGTSHDIIVTANIVDQACANATDAQIALVTSGGVGTLSYLWSNGKTTSTINGLSVGTYTVTITDEESKNMVQNYAIEVLGTAPVISSTETTPTTDTQAGGTATVSVEGCSDFSYAWSDGQTTATAINLTTGEYTVTVTDCNGCTVESTVIVEQTITSISETALATSINITPNPARDWMQVNVQLPSTLIDQPTTIQLMNTTGQVVSRFNTTNQQAVNINVANYPAGLYYLQLQIGEQTLVKKITIVK